MTSSVSSSNGESVTSNRRQSNPDPFEERRRLEQEQLDRLLQDPNFRLLMVEHGEAQIDGNPNEVKSLTVVTPATHDTIARDVTFRGWKCLSHLWGDPSEWIDWDDAGVDDWDTGEPIKPKVHSDKRDEIMSLLQKYDGYWWIDIFCAQSDTPLRIMGDIYKHCRHCIALINNPYGMADFTIFKLFTDTIRLSIRHIEQAADGYLGIINKTHHKHDVSTEWMRILKDLLYWPSIHFEETTNEGLIELKRWDAETPTVGQFLDSPTHRHDDEKIGIVLQFFISKEYNLNDFDFFDNKEYMESFQEYTLESLHIAQHYVAELLNCRWMNRLWTLQEVALPKSIYACSGESDQHYLSQWIVHSAKLLKVIAKAYEIRETTSMDSQSNREPGAVLQTPRQVLNYYQQTDPVLARIYSDYRKVLEVAIAFGYTSRHRSNEDTNDNLGRRILLNSLATSERMALYPEDYVYGVLGILDIDIPRLEDRDEIWRIFSEKLRERYPDIHVPGDVSLDKATKMEDVYGGFGFTRGWDLSSEVVDYLCGWGTD